LGLIYGAALLTIAEFASYRAFHCLPISIATDPYRRPDKILSGQEGSRPGNSALYVSLGSSVAPSLDPPILFSLSLS
jgi:hypothetical protein